MEYTSIVKERLQKRLSSYSPSTIDSFIASAQMNNGKITINHSTYLLDKAGNLKRLEKNTETGYTGYKSVRGEDVLQEYLQSTSLLSKLSSYVPQPWAKKIVSAGVAASIFLSSFAGPCSALSKDAFLRLRQLRKSAMSRGYVPTTEQVDGQRQEDVEKGYRIMAKKSGISPLEMMTVKLKNNQEAKEQISGVESLNLRDLPSKIRVTKFALARELAKEDHTVPFPSTIEARERNLKDPFNVSIVLSPNLYSAQARSTINYAFENTNRAPTRENKRLALEAYRAALNLGLGSMEFREHSLSASAAKEMAFTVRLTSERRMLCGAVSPSFKGSALQLALQGVRGSSLNQESKRLVTHYLRHPHSNAEGDVSCSSNLVGFDADTMLNK